MSLPDPPARAFASDNAAGAHPAVIEAIVRANHGHALAYGDDDVTRRCEHAFDDLFGRNVATFLTFNGTGANVMALTALARPGDAVICTSGAHINVDETGAPERIAGTKLIDLPAPDGKLTPEQIDEQSHAIGVPHHAQPALVSITQSTELGTLYTVDEMAALCATAHRHGMRVHVDGARIANAVAALGCTVDTLRDITLGAGVDVISFGGTKNGALGGEAVVFLEPSLAARAEFVRKTVTQLPSKMRFIAAQFEALLTDDLWIELAAHSNRMATFLYEQTSVIPGVTIDQTPAVNSVFPTLPRAAIEPLRAWSFFWDWNSSIDQVRWMTAWDTTADDVARFAAGVRTVLASCN
jgi:threonine aldolase